MYKSVGEMEKIGRRVRAADYLTVAQLFLRDNFYYLCNYRLSKYRNNNQKTRRHFYKSSNVRLVCWRHENSHKRTTFD